MRPGYKYLAAGAKFNRLTLLNDVDRARDMGVFLCDCGVKKSILASTVKYGKTASCGCALKTHGMRATKIYNVWNGMICRVKHGNDEQAKNYEARGIEICDRWMKFENFYEDMGNIPFEGAQLDRIDNDLGYSPSNCRWVSRVTNNNNKRNNRIFEYDGESKTMSEWSRDSRCIVSYGTLNRRIQDGWLFERAITEPVNKNKISNIGNLRNK